MTDTQTVHYVYQMSRYIDDTLTKLAYSERFTDLAACELIAREQLAMYVAGTICELIAVDATNNERVLRRIGN